MIRLKTNYSQHRAETGRLSSGVNSSELDKTGDKILQVHNIPKKLRDAVIAPPGYTFVGGDWAGIQWAIAMYYASLLNDPPAFHADLLNQFWLGQFDPHSHLASHAFGKPKVSKQERQLCKSYTYGYLFDGAPSTLAREAGHADKIGKQVCQAHDEAFKTRRWKTYTVEEAKRMRYVQTPLGFRRYFWGLNPKPTEILGQLIQGTEADLLKWTMLEVDDTIEHQLGPLLTTNHDSFVMESRQEKVIDCKEWLKWIMETPVPWMGNHRFRAEIKEGKTWREVS